jgi:Carbohydrate esterase, sialic acid-specific acetylesterase
MIRISLHFLLVPLALLAFEVRSGAAAEPLTLAAPLAHSVTQRQGLVLRKATSHEPSGPERGIGQVNVAFNLPDGLPVGDQWVAQYRVVAMPAAWGTSTDWITLSGVAQGKNWQGTAPIAAGGWYRLEVRLRSGQQDLAAGAVEPIGVGEVFLIAGQSYAANSNDESLKSEEPAGRVVAFDFNAQAWRVAHDPQPVVDGSTHGSIWPPVGDSLAAVLRVPIGLANVAVGGSASAQWLPGTLFCDRLIAAGKTQGSLRAVLWQQGESDVINKTSTDTYVKNILAIRAAASQAWGSDKIPWLLAKSTLHPTVYNDPEGEGKIRAGIDELCRHQGFRPGPDTDLLDGENRGPVGSMRHFSAVGQRRAATLWFASIWQLLNSEE